MSKASNTPEFVRQVFTHTDKSSDLDIQFLARNQRELEQYTTLSDREIETQEWIKNFANSGTFLDIGANIGLFSLMASRYKPEMKVLAVEPHIPSFETLFQNIKLNSCANVHPLNAAFAERTEIGVFNYMKLESGTAKKRAMSDVTIVPASIGPIENSAGIIPSPLPAVQLVPVINFGPMSRKISTPRARRNKPMSAKTMREVSAPAVTMRRKMRSPVE